ncbi:outer membrane beta-barrel protein [Campylobacter majalis]|uniref:outer membrane beta-barrel protein n=1 Tax=Campylobacter majalis TaxID=2790656 RepID=UPI003D68DD99
MKKVLVSALVAGVCASAAFAEGAFVGVNAGYDIRSQLKADGDKVKDSRPTIELKAGYDFDIFRVYGSYEYGFEAKDSIDGSKLKYKTHKFLLNADYTPEITTDLKLVAGGYVGASYLKLKVFDEAGTNKVSDTAPIIGLRLGAQYSLDTNNAIEFGVKTDYAKHKRDGESAKNTNTGLYLGYNYKF